MAGIVFSSPDDDPLEKRHFELGSISTHNLPGYFNNGIHSGHSVALSGGSNSEYIHTETWTLLSQTDQSTEIKNYHHGAVPVRIYAPTTFHCIHPSVL